MISICRFPIDDKNDIQLKQLHENRINIINHHYQIIQATKYILCISFNNFQNISTFLLGVIII